MYPSYMIIHKGKVATTVKAKGTLLDMQTELKKIVNQVGGDWHHYVITRYTADKEKRLCK